MVAIIYILSVLEAVGNLTATAMVSNQPIKGEVYQNRLKGGNGGWCGVRYRVSSRLAAADHLCPEQRCDPDDRCGLQLYRALYCCDPGVLGLFRVSGWFFTTIPAPVLGGQ